MLGNSGQGSRIGHRAYEDALREGITAAKGGRRSLARRLLGRAAIMRPGDARPWLWLSATTDDPVERIKLLEKAVALDPNNAAARQGLVKMRLQQKGIEPTSAAPTETAPPAEEPLEAEAQTYTCQNCGGRMRYSVDEQNLVCEYCGHIHVVEEHKVADTAEQGLDMVMHTQRAHRWAAAQHRVSCEHCGAITLFDPGQRTGQCPYCGSNQLIESEELIELVDPQAIAVIKVNKDEALKQAKAWLGKGLFAPDDLAKEARKLRIRPAYYPFWTFDGTLEAHWTCEVRENTYGGGMGTASAGQKNYRWEPRSGVLHKFFDDVLVSGSEAVSRKELKSIQPFDLKEVVEFKPEHLAGWPSLTYDRSLSDASLLAREQVIRKYRREAHSRIEPSREKRKVKIGAGNWSGMSFKHVLLPVWAGTYHYKGEEHHVLVNGQTGKVGGGKPQDNVKVVGVWAIVAVLVLALSMLLVWFFVERF